MNKQRAQEIAASPIMHNVTLSGVPVYIQHVDEHTDTASGTAYRRIAIRMCSTSIRPEVPGRIFYYVDFPKIIGASAIGSSLIPRERHALLEAKHGRLI